MNARTIKVICKALDKANYAYESIGFSANHHDHNNFKPSHILTITDGKGGGIVKTMLAEKAQGMTNKEIDNWFVGEVKRELEAVK